MKTVLELLLIGAAWAGGFGYGRWYAKPHIPAPGEKKVLYWVDAMHP